MLAKSSIFGFSWLHSIHYFDFLLANNLRDFQFYFGHVRIRKGFHCGTHRKKKYIQTVSVWHVFFGLQSLSFRWFALVVHLKWRSIDWRVFDFAALTRRNGAVVMWAIWVSIIAAFALRTQCVGFFFVWRIQIIRIRYYHFYVSESNMPKLTNLLMYLHICSMWNIQLTADRFPKMIASSVYLEYIGSSIPSCVCSNPAYCTIGLCIRRL